MLIILAFFLQILLFEPVSCEKTNLLILHNNDIHAQFEETSSNSGKCKPNDKKLGCYGGMARLAHVIRKYRMEAEMKKGPDVLFLNAGDTFVGTPWFGIYREKICIDFMNVLKPDAISLGNHEFDYGPSVLAKFVEGVQSPVIAANINYSREPEMKNINKSIILNIHGTRIGIVGYITPLTKNISHIGKVEIFDEIPALKKESERLDKLGVKIIIALGHSGFEPDKKIAREVPLVDLVVGGHSNTFLWNGVKPDREVPVDVYPKVITQPSGKKVPVVQAYAFSKYLGILNVTFDENGDLIDFEGQPLLLDSKIPEDQDVLDKLDLYRPEVDALYNKVIGKSKIILDTSTCSLGECTLGNFMADGMVKYVALQSSDKYWTDTPIGIINAGTIRNTIVPHNTEITKGDLLSALPFDSRFVSLSLKGSDLLKMLEIGARSNERYSGEFLQVSGLKVVFDYSKPSFYRLVSVKARCRECEIPVYEDVNVDQNYTLVTTDFLSEGGDNFDVLKFNSFNKKVQDITEVDLAEWYMQQQGVVFSEITERITCLHRDKNTGSKLVLDFKLLSIMIIPMYFM